MKVEDYLELLEIIERQNEMITELVNEDFGQEDIINVLMRERM